MCYICLISLTKKYFRTHLTSIYQKKLFSYNPGHYLDQKMYFVDAEGQIGQRGSLIDTNQESRDKKVLSVFLRKRCYELFL